MPRLSQNSKRFDRCMECEMYRGLGLSMFALWCDRSSKEGVQLQLHGNMLIAKFGLSQASYLCQSPIVSHCYFRLVIFKGQGRKFRQSFYAAGVIVEDLRNGVGVDFDGSVQGQFTSLYVFLILSVSPVSAYISARNDINRPFSGHFSTVSTTF